MPNWPKEWTEILIPYARISSIRAIHVLSWDIVQIVRVQIHKIQNFLQVMFTPLIRTDKTYVGCKYTNFITSSGISQALVAFDRLYVECQNTSCFVSNRSILWPIFITVELLFVRNYTNFKNFLENINELDHFVRMVVSVFMENRYIGVWARKYKRFDVTHASTLLSYLSKVINRFIQLAKVIICVNFLQR
jgi:hypothetical protein